MEENKVAIDSSAPNSPDLTGFSGEQAEERTAREIRKELERAKEFLLSDLELDGYTPANIVHQRAKLLLSECSRLASRVEELEKALGLVREYVTGYYPNDQLGDIRAVAEDALNRARSK